LRVQCAVPYNCIWVRGTSLLESIAFASQLFEIKLVSPTDMVFENYLGIINILLDVNFKHDSIIDCCS
jgi:hypothetical protein